MMDNLISTALQKQFEAEVRVVYNKYGSKLQTAVRNKKNLESRMATFQPICKGTAQEKSLASEQIKIIPEDGGGIIKCPLQEHYACQWIDHNSDFADSVDERLAIAISNAHAIGRKADDLIIGMLNKAKYKVSDGGKGLTLEKISSALVTLGDNQIPDDGQRFGIVGWKQWSELLNTEQFAKLPYVQIDSFGTQAKSWLGVLWTPHSGLDVAENKARKCYLFHKNSIGYAYRSEVKTSISWHGDRAAYFVNTNISHGAAVIDRAGIVSIESKEK